MSAIATTAEHAATRPESQRFTRDEIAALKQRDNLTNFGYIAGIYAVIIITAVAAIGVFEAYRAGEIGLGWAILAGFLAVLSMGASQHQFGAVIHEATHYMLFENRKLNEPGSRAPQYTHRRSHPACTISLIISLSMIRTAIQSRPKHQKAGTGSTFPLRTSSWPRAS